MPLQIGDVAPAFHGTTTDGETRRLYDYRGKKLVLYFYPRDDTPGCTKEACSFRDHLVEIRATGAEILGVSTDNVGSHRKFTAKYSLNFPLIADTSRAIGKAYGTLSGVKGLLGLASRWTFIIDEAGKISHIFSEGQVDAARHADQILAVLQP